MCSKSFKEQKVREYMSLDMIESLVEQAKAMGVYSFWGGAGSECMLHPQIVEALRILMDANTIDFTLLSNGSLLSYEVSRVFVEHQAGQLSISLDAATPKTYKIIRRGGTLDPVERNIQHFLDLRGNQLFPLLRVSMVKLDDNKDEREAFLEKWENRADVIDFQTCVDFRDVNDVEGVVKWSNDCTQPFKRLYINYDGTITPCCTSYGKYFTLGNARDMTLQEAWDCDTINKLRKMLLDGDLPKSCRKCREIK